jgi:hypothetical protein
MNTNKSIKIFLKTDGYHLIFEFSNKNIRDKTFDIRVDFNLNSDIKDISFRSVESFIYDSELQRLINYLTKHINCLKQNPNHESDVFLGYSLAFKIQASCGDIEPNGSGSFGIMALVNMGESTYLGGESLITVDSVQSFISSLERLMKCLSSKDDKS